MRTTRTRLELERGVGDLHVRQVHGGAERADLGRDAQQHARVLDAQHLGLQAHARPHVLVAEHGLREQRGLQADRGQAIQPVGAQHSAAAALGEHSQQRASASTGSHLQACVVPTAYFLPNFSKCSSSTREICAPVRHANGHKRGTLHKCTQVCLSTWSHTHSPRVPHDTLGARTCA